MIEKRKLSPRKQGEVVPDHELKLLIPNLLSLEQFEQLPKESRRQLVLPSNHKLLLESAVVRINECVARFLLGWRLARKGEEHTLIDLYGNKVVLDKSLSQRPFKIALAKRWMRSMVQRRWKLNGESVIIDNKKMIHDGQHRLAGLVLACQLRDRAPHLYDDYWPEKCQCYFDTFVHIGINSDPDVVNTINTGLVRSNGDAFYQSSLKTGLTKAVARQHANILAHAVRLVYLNLCDKMPSYGVKLENEQAATVEQEFPFIIDAVNKVIEMNGGSGVDGRKLQQFITLGYAAGLLACMSTYNSDFDHPEPILWGDAVKFWESMISGSTKITEAARKRLSMMPQGSGRDRDLICLVVSKAWMCFIERRKGSAEDLDVMQDVDARGNTKILDVLQLGAIDGYYVRKGLLRDFTE